MTDFTYVDNVAHAHICAEESLRTQMNTVSGKVPSNSELLLVLSINLTSGEKVCYAEIYCRPSL